MAILVGLTTGIGVYTGNRLAQQRAASQFPLMPPIELNAGTAARSKSMSMATGLIDGEVEGLFVLDHLSGNLQCWALSPKTGAVAGIYRVNVLNDIRQPGKTGEPDYIMTTGNFFFSGGNPNNATPGQTVCYVADASTGIVAGYGLTYNKQRLSGTSCKKALCAGSAKARLAAAR